jgi:hypothetical protein
LLNKINNKISLSGFQPLQHKQTPLKPTKKPTINTAMKNTKLTIYTTIACLGACLPSANAATLTVDGTTNNFSSTTDYTQVTVTDGGTLNLTGGALTLTRTSPSNNHEKFFVNSGSTLNFVGGTHTINERIATYGATTSTIRITGSEATINVHQQSTFTATMDFVFDANGISTFDSDSRLGFSSSTIDIDVSAYTGGDATFVLVDTDLFNGSYASNGGGFGTINTITNTAVNSWGGGYDVTYDQSLFDGAPGDGFTGQITLTLTAVPEPSSTALLGLGGLAMMLRRKRN